MLEHGEGGRKSIHELMTTLRRRSFFETPQEQERNDAKLKAWDQRWGYIQEDFVNVASYPNDYIRSFNEEKDGWICGLKEMVQKAEKIANKRDRIQVITGCELSPERSGFVAHVESKIEQFWETAVKYGRDAEVEAFHKLTLDEDNDIKLVKKLITSKK